MILQGSLPDVPLKLTLDAEDNLAIDFDASQLDPAGFKPEEVPAEES